MDGKIYINFSVNNNILSMLLEDSEKLIPYHGGALSKECLCELKSFIDNAILK